MDARLHGLGLATRLYLETFEAMEAHLALFEVIEGTQARILRRSPPLRALAALGLDRCVVRRGGTSDVVATSELAPEVFEKIIVDVRLIRLLRRSCRCLA